MGNRNSTPHAYALYNTDDSSCDTLTHDNMYESGYDDSSCDTLTHDNMYESCYDVVRWLHKNRQEGWAMDNAARHGHLENVKWLHKNRPGRCIREAMDRAART